MAGYVRQSSVEIVPTAVVRSAPVNAEFNAVRDAFSSSTGHKHDGTTAEGVFVPLIADSDANNKVVVDTATNTVIFYNEVSGAPVAQFRVQDGAIVPVTDNDIDLGTSALEFKNLYLDGIAKIDTLTIDENATIAGTLGVTGQLNGSTIVASGFTGPLTGAVAGNVTGNLTGNVTGNVVGNITSTGTSTFSAIDVNGGAIDGTIIGAAAPAASNFTTLGTSGQAALASVNIDGGTIDGTAVGVTVPAAGTFTTLSATTGITGGLTGNVTGNLTGNVTGAVTGNVTGNLTGNVTAATGSSSFNDMTINGSLNMNAGTSATITNLSAPVLSSDAATKGYVDAADALKLNLSGGTMSGTLAMGTSKITGLGNPTLAQDAATKAYVDAEITSVIDAAPAALDTLNELAAALGDDANFSTTVTNSIATKLPLAGGTMSGPIAMGTSQITGLGNPTLAQDATTKTYVDAADALKLNLAGGTMSGAIAMGTSKITGLGDPTANQDASTKVYVDTADALKVTKAGDTMSGDLAMGSNKVTGLAAPTLGGDATNKTYVDGILGSATAAADSAAAALVSETNAATSESNASTSEINAAASYDAFDDRYLGSKASEPTLDNDGNALLTGALYWNSTSSALFIWTGSAWSAAAFDASGALVAGNNLSELTDTAVARTNLGFDGGVDTHLNTGTATTGQYLGWNGADYAWSTVSGYTDTDVDTHLNTGTATTGEVLSWTGSDYDWVPSPSPELYAENYDGTSTKPSATGDNAVAIGSGSVASGDRSIALGDSASATSFRTFAVGVAAIASDFNSIAMGPTSSASGNASVAIGNGAISVNTNAVVLGRAYASGEDSFAAAIANNSSSYGATGSNSVAIGRNAKATATYATAIGNSVTASQVDGAVALGSSSTASGLGSFAAGYLNIASGSYSQAIGYGANTQSIYGKFAKSSGFFSNYADMQTGILVLVAATTDATPKALTSNKAAAGTTNQIILPNNSAYSFSGTIIARQQASAGSEYASWEVKGALLRDATAATTVLGNGIKNKLFASTGAAAWDLALTADTTNGGLAITVTGAAATNIRWVATVNTSEVTY